MLLVGNISVADVTKEDVEKIGYFELDSDESWKVGSIRELIQVQQGLIEVPVFGSDELETTLNYLCTSSYSSLFPLPEVFLGVSRSSKQIWSFPFTLDKSTLNWCLK